MSYVFYIYKLTIPNYSRIKDKLHLTVQMFIIYSVWFVQGLLDLMDDLATMDQMDSQVYQDKRENQE